MLQSVQMVCMQVCTQCGWMDGCMYVRMYVYYSYNAENPSVQSVSEMKEAKNRGSRTPLITPLPAPPKLVQKRHLTHVVELETRKCSPTCSPELQKTCSKPLSTSISRSLPPTEYAIPRVPTYITSIRTPPKHQLSLKSAQS